MLFLRAVLCVIAVFLASSQVYAGSYRDYDEDVVRAYKKAKIKKVFTEIPAPEANIEQAVIKFSENYFKEHKNKKIKRKPEIVLLEYEPFEKTSKTSDGTIKTEKFLKVKMYGLENPEKFLFSLNKGTSRKHLMDRAFIKDMLDEDLLAYSILSEKIERKDASFLRKTASFSYNGFLGVMVLAPKLGFGYLLNPPLNWMKTNSPKDIYNNVSSELEALTIGDKEFKHVILVQ